MEKVLRSLVKWVINTYQNLHERRVLNESKKSQALMLEIEEKRREMIYLASNAAYWDDRVLQASRHLDQLINQFNKLKKR
ncbi:hypothetical protein BpJC7_26580 [Weizmannia acidilactici]|uniref:Aspartyl-phosphate phosphatase Spo0E family protein n=1 Tax=Weizmannia acidilactici TaxID=2607726 RepID=A0A5J4JKY4_9BACI|nr:hypothetical protein BpJC4_31390 [Weizmannia acidilactici]GER71355.1 hypothetical protein BpJC7_26580 [Weizmannia acidilactici]GER74787.1 hypothetical protein BpPP18_28540 [Weizmannia acidilactici]